MALPFLPPGHINAAFTILKKRANSPGLQQLTNYIQRQWFENAVFPIPSWCVYQQLIRAKNDVEGKSTHFFCSQLFYFLVHTCNFTIFYSSGWHTRMNKKSAGIGIYRLIPNLRREAELVSAAVTAEDLNRHVQPKFSNLQQRLQDVWDKYAASKITTAHFLKTIGKMYGINDQ